VCAEFGVKKVFMTAYHPQTYGQVERYNLKILAALRGYVARRRADWDQYTSTLTYAYNCRVYSILGMTPFELSLKRPLPQPPYWIFLVMRNLTRKRRSRPCRSD
jgi:transposase InsO family protein